MAAPKRSKHQTQNDLLFVASKLVLSKTVRQIAELLNQRNEEQGAGYTLSYVQIHKDVKKIFKMWKKERDVYIAEILQLQLNKIDKIEEELWIAWEKSKKVKEKTKYMGGTMVDGKYSGGKLYEKLIETTPGNSRYLERIESCVDMRAKLLGMYDTSIVTINQIVKDGIDISYTDVHGGD